MLAGRTRETSIRRDARGHWFDGDTPITHPLLTRAFDAWIERAEDGRYCLRNDINWAYVAIEGPPIFVRRVDVAAGRVTLHLSDGRDEPLSPSSLRQDAEGALYCQVRGGTLPARFDSHAAVQLSEVIGEGERGAFLDLEGGRVHPPIVDDPLHFER